MSPPQCFAGVHASRIRPIIGLFRPGSHDRPASSHSSAIAASHKPIVISRGSRHEDPRRRTIPLVLSALHSYAADRPSITVTELPPDETTQCSPRPHVLGSLDLALPGTRGIESWDSATRLPAPADRRAAASTTRDVERALAAVARCFIRKPRADAAVDTVALLSTGGRAHGELSPRSTRAGRSSSTTARIDAAQRRIALLVQGSRTADLPRLNLSGARLVHGSAILAR